MASRTTPPPHSSRVASPPASIVIPTRGRPEYLQAALASIAPQAAQACAELIVVDDAVPSEEARCLAERFGARYEPHGAPLGLNVARNTGVERSTGELLVFVDDDVQVCEGWLAALLRAAGAHPDVDVFAGPITPRLEGSPPRSCGREGPPITSLQLGPEDRETRYAWGANMAVRRRALERVGRFDASLRHGGDEQEWQDRLRAAGGRVLYVAGAGLLHRRNARDARLRSLCRAALTRGRAARRFDARRGEAPGLRRELLTLGGCLGHVVRRGCPAGLVMAAHSAGRVLEATGRARAGSQPERPGSLHARARLAQPGGGDSSGRGGDSSGGGEGGGSSNGGTEDDFLSGESGTVGGLDGVRRAVADRLADALQIASGQRRRLARAARRQPPARQVLALCVQRPERRQLAEAIGAELRRSRHDVELRVAPAAGRAKFENLNLLLGEKPPWAAGADPDWVVLVDDDISLPRGFLDRFLFVAERFALDLAQPAHAYSSHAAWGVTRRRTGSVVRETQFVEIGPLTALARRTLATLLPFPDVRMGWGLDAHWAALARERGWRCGVIDALPIHHRAAPAAQAYSREQALAEARAFLRNRPYLSASEAQRTLAVHRTW